MVEQWSATYDGAAHLDDRSNAIRVDNSGNVYVTGYTTTASQGRDYATIKYNSSGTQQWVKYYNGKDNADDEANALVVDNAGNIYVTGQSTRVENLDYYTLKYNASGTQIWGIDYNGTGNGDDKASCIALDNTGAIVVSGQTFDILGTYTYTTMRYVERSLFTVPDTEEIPTSFDVIENRGQLLHNDNTLASEVKYYTDKTYPSVFFQYKMASLVWSKVDTNAATPDTVHRVDMVMGYGKSSNGFALNPYEEHTNYYLGHCPKGVEKLRSYNTIVYPEMYTNIDVQYTANNRGLKIHFIVKPTGTASSISVNFNGASSLTVNGSGDLVIGSPLKNLILKKARAYQIATNGTKVTLAWQPSYSITGSTLTFTSIGTYNTALPLVIEMYEYAAFELTDGPFENVGWSTLYGGNNFDQVNGVAPIANTEGALYTGYTTSQNFPVVTAASYPANANYFNAFAVNFKNTGQRNWTSVFGGYANDVATGIAVEHSNYAYIVGTCSKAQDNLGAIVSNNFPQIIPTGSYQKTANNIHAYYGFITKMAIGSGVMEWSTLMGDDGSNTPFLPNAIYVDVNSFVYVCGKGHRSATLPSGQEKFPLVAFGVQTINNNGTSIEQTSGEGGFITVFNWYTNTIKWSTLFGGVGTVHNDIIGGSDGICVLSTVMDGFYTIPQISYGVGNTYSPAGHAGGPANSPSDWHLMKINGFTEPDPCRIKWAFPFGGDGHDQANKMILTDIKQTGSNDGTVVVVGYTFSSASSLPFSLFNNLFPQAYVDNTSDSTDALIAGFGYKSGDPRWLTYYGGDNGINDELYNVTYDANKKVIHAAGKTSSNDNYFPGTNLPGAYIDNTKSTGDEDALLVSFASDLSLVYATMYGNHDDNFMCLDRIYAITTVGNSLFIGGVSGKTDPAIEYNIPTYIESPGAYFQNLTIGQSNDGFMARFKMELTPLDIIEPINHSTMSVYPNPTNNQIFVNLKEGEYIILDLYDISGKIISNECIQLSSKTYAVDLSTLPQGVYILKVISGGKVSTTKVVKQ